MQEEGAEKAFSAPRENKKNYGLAVTKLANMQLRECNTQKHVQSTSCKVTGPSD